MIFSLLHADIWRRIWDEIRSRIFGRMEIVDLPEGNDMRENGEAEKCIYRFRL